MDEQYLRNILANYGIGFELIEFTKHDRITAYPTKRPNIHKIQLNLRRKLDCIAPPEELLKHLLTRQELEDWRSKKALFDVPNQSSEAKKE